jgi:hypothetical protein
MLLIASWTHTPGILSCCATCAAGHAVLLTLHDMLLAAA